MIALHPSIEIHHPRELVVNMRPSHAIGTALRVLLVLLLLLLLVPALAGAGKTPAGGFAPASGGMVEPQAG